MGWCELSQLGSEGVTSELRGQLVPRRYGEAAGVLLCMLPGGVLL